jgi:protein-S-isoprenylcysteine O-methyltransferase Ste14
MPLREEIEKQGQFLFKWRSYLPLFAIPLFIAALAQSQHLKAKYGDMVDLLWTVFSVIISFFGLLVRCLVAGFVPRGTSGRNTLTQRAEFLNTTGMYSIVRNPLYLGNFLITLGLFMLTQAWWFILLGTLGFLLYYERIIFTEEEFLRLQYGKPFIDWASHTPVFFPDFRLWRKPVLAFSFKTVLRREHSTFFAIIASFTFLHIASGLLLHKTIMVELGWRIFFVCGFVTYFILRFLKKKTKLLNVKDR